MTLNFLAMLAKFRNAEDAVFSARLSSLGTEKTSRRSRRSVSPFRFVARKAPA